MRKWIAVSLGLVLIGVANGQGRDEAARLCAEPMDRGRAQLVVELMKGGDAETRRLLCRSWATLWPPFLDYIYELPIDDGWQVHFFYDLNATLGQCASQGMPGAVEALGWFKSWGCQLDSYPVMGLCGNGLEAEVFARNQLDKLSPKLVTAGFSSTRPEVFYATGQYLAKLLPDATKKAAFGALTSTDGRMRRAGLLLLIESKLPTEEADRLLPYLNDEETITRLRIADEMPFEWIRHWRGVDPKDLPVMVRMAMVKHSVVDTQGALSDPDPDVRERGIAFADAAREDVDRAAASILAAGPYPPLEVRRIVDALEHRLGPERVIELALKANCRYARDLPMLLAFKQVDEESMIDRLCVYTRQLVPLFEKEEQPGGWRFARGSYDQVGPLIDRLIVSRHAGARALAFETIDAVEGEIPKAARNRYAALLVGEPEIKIQADYICSSILRSEQRNKLLTRFRAKLPGPDLVSLMNDLTRLPAAFAMPWLKEFEKSANPQVLEMARLTLKKMSES